MIRKAAAVLFAITLLFAPSQRSEAIFLGIAGGNGPGTWQGYGVYNVKDTPFSATGNGVLQPSCAISSSSANLTCAGGASFAAGDVGKVICVSGAGASGAPLVTTILTFTDATHVVLNANAGTTVSTGIVHYGTDDTTAVQAAITAAFNAGGGTVFFPRGIYVINGAFQNPSTQNGQLVIPYVATSGTVSPTVISLVGVTTIPTNSGGCCDLTGRPIAGGSILFTPKNGSGTAPALISPYSAGSSSDFSDVALDIEGLVLRSAYLNTTPLQMVNARWTTYLKMSSVTIDTDASTAVVQATQPVANGYGFVMPDNQNGTFSRVDNTVVFGYDTGALVGEHADIDSLSTFYCKYGMQLLTFYHAVRIGRYGAFEDIYPIASFSGVSPSRSPIDIQLYDSEHASSGWYQTTNDVLDAGNIIYGHIERYNVILAGTGYSNGSFSKSGGTNLTATALY